MPRRIAGSGASGDRRKWSRFGRCSSPNWPSSPTSSPSSSCGGAPPGAARGGRGRPPGGARGCAPPRGPPGARHRVELDLRRRRARPRARHRAVLAVQPRAEGLRFILHLLCTIRCQLAATAFVVRDSLVLLRNGRIGSRRLVQVLTLVVVRVRSEKASAPPDLDRLSRNAELLRDLRFLEHPLCAKALVSGP